MKHEAFHYRTLDQLRQTLRRLGLTLPLSENYSVLAQPLRLKNGKASPNRIVVQPMEGCDGTPDGRPGALTLRRYKRFAESGAGMIWAEATAVCAEGRANPRQLWICPENVGALGRMVEQIKETSMKKNGFAPLVIMQATHSGRYAKPNGVPEPVIAYQNPLFEKTKPISPASIITDDELKALEELYGRAARLAEQAGFDGIDIKACHRYLVSELLSAYGRPGIYGGSFENRTRLYRNAALSARAAVSSACL